jgi:hypothetical protein
MEWWNDGLKKDIILIECTEGGPSIHHPKSHYSIFPAFQYSKWGAAL